MPKNHPSHRLAHQPLRPRTGFTLAELLVGSGVLMLLVSILVPSLGRARQSAQRVACLSTLHHYGAANLMYLAEYQTWAPVKVGVNFAPGPEWPAAPTGMPPSQAPLQPWYMSGTFRQYLGLGAEKTGRVPAGMVCPLASLAAQAANAHGYPVCFSYGYNFTDLDWYAGADVYFMGYRPDQVRHPSAKLMFADATDWVIRESTSASYLDQGEVYGPPPRWNMTAYRHNNGADVVFFDGHTEWLPAPEVVHNDRLWRVTK